ncbi:MAG: P-II family nitrogen regulator [Acidobacteria bacterium]|nr:P-II family nitrogen regulator [Acidobacteriota bacterium]
MERKLIVAVVRPFLLDKVVVALENIEQFPGITIAEAEGFGHRLRNTLDDALNPFHPKKQIEIAAPQEMVEEIVEAICKHAHAGKKGDGIIWVMPIEQTIII